MFTINGRTDAQQAMAHGEACLTYAREALAEGRTMEAEGHVYAAENWFRIANGETTR